MLEEDGCTGSSGDSLRLRRKLNRSASVCSKYHEPKRGQAYSVITTKQLKAASSGIETTGCGTTDYKCLCSAKTFLAALQSQVMTECTSAEYQGKLALSLSLSKMSNYYRQTNECVFPKATLSFAQGICASVDITLNLPSTDTMTTASSTTTAATAASPVYSQATSAATDNSGSTAATTAVTASWSSYASSPSSAAVSTNSNPTTTTYTSAPIPSPRPLSTQSYIIPPMTTSTDVTKPSNKNSITTTSTSTTSNRSSNKTIYTRT